MRLPQSAGLAAVALAAVLLAVVSLLWLTPDTGPPLDDEAVDVEAAVAAKLKERPPIAPPPLTDPSRLPRPVRHKAPAPEPVAPEPNFEDHDFDQTYDADLMGLSMAATARRPRVVECFRSFKESGKSLSGRMTLKVSIVGEEGYDEASPTVGLANSTEEHPDLDRCLSGAFDDAHFEVPDEGEMTLMWPVVMPKELLDDSDFQ